MIDSAALQMVLGVLTGWLDRREREAVAYLIEENRLLRRQLGTRRLRLTDWIGSCRSASGTSGGRWRSTSRTIAANGITKGSAIG